MAFHPVDVHVGMRVRQRRTLLGMSQDTLGKAVGLTFQQIQKYERGANRIGMSRAFEFSKVLDIPMSYFTDDMPTNVLLGRPARRGRPADIDTTLAEEKDPLAKRETLELVRAYYKIDDDRVRGHIFEMVKAVGKASRQGNLGAHKGATDSQSTRVTKPRAKAKNAAAKTRGKGRGRATTAAVIAARPRGSSGEDSLARE